LANEKDEKLSSLIKEQFCHPDEEFNQFLTEKILLLVDELSMYENGEGQLVPFGYILELSQDTTEVLRSYFQHLSETVEVEYELEAV